MADMQKKMAAAMAAVSAYLQMEESAATEQSQAVATPSHAQEQMNLWAQCGRQDMMTMRRLIQIRAFSHYR